MASYLTWYYIIGSGVVLYALYGVYKSMTWIWKAISNWIKNSTGPYNVTVENDLIIPPSSSHRRHIKRIPSFSRAFSYPAHIKTNRCSQQKVNR